ncbi:hypothetical protein LOZ65_002956 [Ophidiomyces ophidiicola]|nr:hypothetical protein LOZ65_002956 [Ophidiomyces ophidiicola]
MASPSRSELEARFPLSYPIFSKLVTTTSPEFTNSDGYVDFGLSVIGSETGSLTAVRNDLEKLELRVYQKLDGETRGRCEWTVSTDFPKHLKALRDMGNHAKGRWTDAEKSEISLPRRNTLQRESLRKIERLASFYNVVILNDNQSETDATEVDLHPANVDDFLEGLADEWGLEWYDIMRISNDEPNVLAGKKRGAKFWEERNVRARAG